MTKVATISNIEMNAAVSMTDLAAIFVSKYEDALIVQRDKLQSQVRLLKKTIDEVKASAVKAVADAHSDKNVVIAALRNMTVKVVVTLRSDEVSANVVVEATFDKSDRSYATNLFSFVEPITEDHKQQLVQLKQELEVATAELTRILGELRDVSRKERAVRARISSLKLESLGMTDLLNDPEMMKMIAV